MSIGSSEGIVIEIEPLREIFIQPLTRDGMSLKEWFLREAQSYLSIAGKILLELSGKEVSIEITEEVE